jgi:uncharacterized membrane protein YbhN (UPF0104 family)
MQRPVPAQLDGATRTRARAWLGQLTGLALLAVTLYCVDPAALLARIAQLHFGFLLVGSVLVLPQLHCLALRWRLTAQQLGFPLRQRRALREYALSMLLNLLLPFGIAGDAMRVVRHAHDSQEAKAPGLANALHGVMLERTLGQVVVIAWALATLPLWFGALGFGLGALGLAALAVLFRLLQRMPAASSSPARSAPVRALSQLSGALQRLLVSPRHLAAQFALSSLITLSIVAQLYCALGALGLSLSAAQATQVFPLMLLSMSVPLAFAGFGPREAATAELYDILHLSAADGAAFALAFGAILICSSLPCLGLVLCLPNADTEPAS